MTGICETHSPEAGLVRRSNRQCSMRDIAKLVPPVMMDTYNKLRELDDKSRQDLHNFLATGIFEEKSINGDNVYKFLEIAQALQYEKLINICEAALLQDLCEQSAVSMFIFGTAYKLRLLRKESLTLIEINIDTICESEEIQHLGPNDLFDLLRNTEIKNSPFALKMVNHWYKYEQEPRQNARNEMVEFLQQVQTRIRPLESFPSESLVYQVMFSECCSNNQNRGLNIHVYEPRNNWQRHYEPKEIKNLGSDFAVCCSQDRADDVPHIYISGGTISPNTVYHCDIIMNTQKKCSKKLNFGRILHNMESVGDSIYVLGGKHDGDIISTVEEFNPKRHSWKIVGNLSTPVHSASSTRYKNEIYVMGGIQENGDYTTLVQKFCPKTGNSTIVGKLPFAASKTESVTYKEFIYVASQNGDMIRFNPKTGDCKHCSSVPAKCRKFAMFAEKDGIYISSGDHHSQRKTREIHRYTPDNNIWERAENDLKCTLPVQAVCEVKIPLSFEFVPFFH